MESDSTNVSEGIILAVENQLVENNPPRVNVTLDRLVCSGVSRKEAVKLIACALSAEIYAVLENQEEFNLARYEKNLDSLPGLPGDSN